MKLSTLAPSLAEALIVLVYAKPKVGKSHFAATAAETDRVVVITDRNGLETYAGAELKKQFPHVNFGNIDVELIDPDPSITEANAFLTLNKILVDLFGPRLDQWDTLIVDDASFQQRSAMNLAIRQNGLTGRSNTAAAASRNRGFNIAPGLTQADYQMEMRYVEDFLVDVTSACRRNKKNLIVCAHEMKIWAKDPAKPKDPEYISAIAPMFTGRRNPEGASKHFSIVMRMTVQGKEASREVRFQCKSDSIVDAGDRYGVLRTFESNLTWRKLKELVAKQVASIEPPTSTPVEDESDDS